MRLAMLLDRSYAPYQKWLGTAFARGAHPEDLPEQLSAALAARGVQAREDALAAAYSALAVRHNSTGLTMPVDPAIRSYHDRPARVLMADRFADACLAGVDDPFLRSQPLIGAVDQWVDNTDVLLHPAVYRRLAGVYGMKDSLA